MSDELLEALARKHEAAGEFSDAPPEPEPESIAVEPSNDAEEMAAFFIGVTNGVAAIFESRLDLAIFEEAAREEVAPIVEKYELHQGGAGEAFGFKPEILFGLFAGRYIKTLIKQFKAWRAYDKEKAKKQNGDKREHESQEQAHALSS